MAFSGPTSVLLRYVAPWLVVAAFACGPATASLVHASTLADGCGSECPCDEEASADHGTAEHGTAEATDEATDDECPADCPECSCCPGAIVAVAAGTESSAPTVLRSAAPRMLRGLPPDGQPSAVFRPPRSLA